MKNPTSTKGNIMNDKYIVKKAAAPVALDAPWESAQWQNANEVHITTLYGDKEPDFIPEVRIRMLYDDQRVCGLFQVKDQYVVARAKANQEQVCQDSCVEFFVKPLNAERYFNFEINCGGTILLYHIDDIHAKRFDLVPEEDLAKIERFHTLPQIIEEEITEPVTWYLGFAVPIEFFQRYSGIDPELSGQAWRANFTKCADKCSHPCWLTWQKLVPPGGYHVPDQFGTIIFE